MNVSVMGELPVQKPYKQKPSLWGRPTAGHLFIDSGCCFEIFFRNLKKLALIFALQSTISISGYILDGVKITICSIAQSNQQPQSGIFR
jgi:hypothetical protein